MSPKPVQRLIKLTCCELGFAERFHWEKEILADYLARRLCQIGECIDEAVEDDHVLREKYGELLNIVRALHEHPNVGLNTKIDLDKVFDDLRGFVTWDKEELADTMIHSIVALGLSDVMKDSHVANQASEISAIAFAILLNENREAADRAEEEFLFYKQNKEAHDTFAARRAAAEGSPSKVAGTAPRKKSAP